MKKNSSDVMSKAILISLILIVVDLIGGFAHLRFASWFKWVSITVLIVGLIVACINWGKQKNDEVSFGKVFGYGFKITALVTLFMIIYTVLSIFLIFPEFKDELLVYTRTNMEAKGGLTEDQIDKAVSFTKEYFAAFAFIGTIFFTLIVGCIGSLLGAAFTKKSEASVFQNNP